MGKAVRFAALIKAFGQPSVYLPLVAPREDKEFMRAVKERRVLTIHQEPTSTRKDAGTVGFLEEKFVTYLVLSKSLKDFDGARVVGIKYDVLEAASVSAAKPKATANGAEPGRRTSAVAPRAAVKENSPAPPATKPIKPEPQPSMGRDGSAHGDLRGRGAGHFVYESRSECPGVGAGAQQGRFQQCRRSCSRGEDREATLTVRSLASGVTRERAGAGCPSNPNCRRSRLLPGTFTVTHLPPAVRS
jgi:hypothetical protein